MSYPTLVAPVDAFPTSTLSTPLDGTAEENQVINLGSTIGWFEVDSTGVPTTNKLGQSGPFILTIGSEQILCSTLKPNQALVYYDSTMNGRGYNSTTVAPAAAGATVTLTSTSVQTEIGTASPTFTGVVTAPAYAASGLTGSVAASRYVGATATGHPTTGAHLLGDFVIDQTGNIWVCTTAGTPGTWTNVNGTNATAGSTVVGPDAFGASATAGAAATFSRSDHDHGLPANPTTAYASATVTETNKRITRRVLALSANSATPAINTDSYDVVHITAQTAAITSFTSGLTGTPVDGDELRVSVTGTGSVAITWGASFESSTVTLPTTTSSTARLDVRFAWNTETSKWRCQLVA